MLEGIEFRLVRPAECAPLPLATLHAEIWQTTYAGLMPAAYLATVTPESMLPVWETACGGGFPADVSGTVAVDAGGAPVGFIVVGPARDADRAGWTQLWALNVAPAWHGHGVAQALVAAYAERLRRSYLLVARGNARAIRFYEKLGYRPSGTVTTAGESGIAELEYVRDLDSDPGPASARGTLP